METFNLKSTGKNLKTIEDLKVEKMAFNGFGLGFFHSDPIFVSNAVPGDILDVRISHQKQDVFFADILKIKTSSEIRIEADCEVYGVCGGCDWLNIPYEEQVRIKEQLQQELFRNVEIRDNLPIIASSEKFYYRNKIFLPVTREKERIIIGLFAKKSHRIVPHKKCYLQMEIFDQILIKIIEYLQVAKVKIYDEAINSGNVKHIGFRYSNSENKILVIIVTKRRTLPFTKQLVRMLREDFPNISGIIQNVNPFQVNRILGNDTKILFGEDFLHDKIGDRKFRFNYQSFFQVNLGITDKLYEFIKSHIEENSNIIDAFSGVGTIGIYLADKAKHVFCIESNKEACIDAEHNVSENGAANCEIICGDVENELSITLRKKIIHNIIFDPPRKGLSKNAINIVIGYKIKKIIYISCNPPTQLRDAEKLLENGYEITHQQAFDMFPQTYHTENVLIFAKKK